MGTRNRIGMEQDARFRSRLNLILANPRDEDIALQQEAIRGVENRLRTRRGEAEAAQELEEDLINNWGGFGCSVM
ncbi:MAG: hypothetical protein LBB37_01060 [Endomicrobium sp.]|nr:hypothetical protein [Endomicrobium sp.]